MNREFDPCLKITVKHGFNDGPGYDWEVLDAVTIGYGNEPTPEAAFAAAMTRAKALTAQWAAERQAEEVPPMTEWAQGRARR